MKYKIVADSSSNLKNDYIKDDKIGFEVIPLTVSIGEKEYVDSDDADVEEMLNDLNSNKEGGKSSCPPPGAYSKAYEEADNIIAITISSKMSGSFNSAFVGSLEHEEKSVHIVDSKATAGVIHLIVDKAYELMKTDMDFKDIEIEIDKYAESLNLLFVLDRFDNLVRAGRMSKISAFVATSLSIKPLCIASKGEIKILKRTRTMKMALKTVINEIHTLVGEDDKNRICIINCVGEDPNALKLKKLIETNLEFKEIRIVKAKILDAYYQLPGGLLISF